MNTPLPAKVRKTHLITIFIAASFSSLVSSCDKIETGNPGQKTKDGEQSESSKQDREIYFLNNYLDLWKSEEYGEMYRHLSSKAKKEMSVERFTQLLEKEKEVNGGPEGLTQIKSLGTDGVSSTWSMTLGYRRKTAAPISIRVGLETDGDGNVSISSGGLLPTDPDNYDR